MDVREWEFQRGYVEVNLDHILENLENMRKHIDTHTKIMAVIKTDGYGHGGVAIAKCVETLDYLFGFAVATAEEAFELRDAGIQKPILVLSYTFPYAYTRFIEQDIRITVFRKDALEEISKAAKKVGKNALVHIKVDTGMGRIGITPDAEGVAFVEKAILTEGIDIEGIFTHFACADETDKTSTMTQMDLFQRFVQGVEQQTGYKIPIHHCSNSAGILDLPQANMDMVRAGITLYGLQPSDEVTKDVVLKPALSLHSHIVYVKTLHAGQSVSYGSKFTASEDTRVATIPLGYGDGYPRSLSEGRGYVLIRGCKAPILGRICMDQFMVDVSHIDNVTEGDRVTLIGCDGSECISADYLGELSGRFNYELVCDLNQRLPRVYIKNGKVINQV